MSVRHKFSYMAKGGSRHKVLLLIITKRQLLVKREYFFFITSISNRQSVFPSQNSQDMPEGPFGGAHRAPVPAKGWHP